MRYMLLIFDSENDFAKLTESEVKKVMEDYGKYSAELKQAGAYITGNRLRPVSTATTVRVRNGKAVFTDGPFAETKEQLLGFYVVDCANEDAAVHAARDLRRINPNAVYEIRPISLYRPGTAIPMSADMMAFQFALDTDAAAARSNRSHVASRRTSRTR